MDSLFAVFHLYHGVLHDTCRTYSYSKSIASCLAWLGRSWNTKEFGLGHLTFWVPKIAELMKFWLMFS